ncbi:MAG: S24 family peptidase [Rikenellaceae bacterium]
MTDWQRLEKVVKWSGMSTNRFAMNIGLKRSENLYQIKRGNFGISKELARLIWIKYPTISLLWLLTGEGEMFEGDGSADSQSEVIKNLDGAVPFYNMDAQQLLQRDMSELEPQHYLVLPLSPGCDFAAKCSGNSMSPLIVAGSTIVLKQTSVEGILPGEAYLVSTPEFSVVRFVRTVENNPDALLLTPRNTTDFDSISISKNKVDSIYTVKAVINYTGF